MLLFVFSLLVIVLSVLLRFNNSDYPFSIFKFFFLLSCVILFLFVLFVFVRVLCQMLPVSLDCPFVTAPSMFSKVSFLAKKTNTNTLNISDVFGSTYTITYITVYCHIAEGHEWLMNNNISPLLVKKIIYKNGNTLFFSG